MGCSVWVVATGSGDQALPGSRAADELRGAFRQFAAASSQQWSIRITSLSQQRQQRGSTVGRHCVRVDLTSDDVEALARILRDAAELAADPSRRGRNWSWIGSVEAARRLGVRASTIRGWVAKRGPRAHPFPRPERQEKGRNYWRPRTIERWKAGWQRKSHDPQSDVDAEQ
jgi:hypothetical protein